MHINAVGTKSHHMFHLDGKIQQFYIDRRDEPVVMVTGPTSWPSHLTASGAGLNPAPQGPTADPKQKQTGHTATFSPTGPSDWLAAGRGLNTGWSG